MRELGHSSFALRHCLTSKKQRRHEQSIRTEILNLTALSSPVSTTMIAAKVRQAAKLQASVVAAAILSGRSAVVICTN